METTVLLFRETAVGFGFGGSKNDPCTWGNVCGILGRFDYFREKQN